MGANPEKAEEAVLVHKKEDKCVLAFQAHNLKKIPGFKQGRSAKRRRGLKASASPYNKRIEQSARGRHGFCRLLVGIGSLGKSRAGSPPAARLPASACGPSSRFIRALYGRWISHLTPNYG